MWDGKGTEHAKWPVDTDFPAFIGISFTQCDDDEEGHGLLIRRLSYWKHESAPGWRNDSESVLFRMWYKAEDLERPADASAELRSGINKQFVQLRYFEACPVKKVFVLLGAEDIPEETTAPVGSYFRYSDPKRKHALVTVDRVNAGLEPGKRPWKYWALHHRYMQFSLSDDNRVLANIDYWRFRNKTATGGKSGKSEDPLQSAAYFIAQPQATISDPALLPPQYLDPTATEYVSPAVDPTLPIAADISAMYDPDAVLKQWQKCFGKDKSQFWQGTNLQARPLYYASEIKNVDSIDHEHGTFTAGVEVDVQWPLTKLEVIEYLSASTAGVPNWVPEWHPPHFYVVNSSSLREPRFVQTKINPYHPNSDMVYMCCRDRVSLRETASESPGVRSLAKASDARRGERVKVRGVVVNPNTNRQYLELADGSGYFPVSDNSVVGGPDAGSGGGDGGTEGMAFELINGAEINENKKKSKHSSIWASQRWRIQGEFYVKYDLRAYPYDTQTLRIELRTSSPSLRVLELHKMHRGGLSRHEAAFVLKTPEWGLCEDAVGETAVEFHHRFLSYDKKDWLQQLDIQSGSVDQHGLRTANSGISIAKQRSLLSQPGGFPQSGAVDADEDGETDGEVETHMGSTDGATLGYYQIVCHLGIKRMSGVYTQRVIVPMGLFSLLSIGTFSLPQTDFAADRLGIPVSLLLTSTAYSLTVSEQIPKVGYLTVLEAYVLLSALFIGFVCLGVIALNYMDSDLLEDRTEDELMQRDVWAVCIAVLLWVLLQGWFARSVQTYRHAREASRIERNKIGARRYSASGPVHGAPAGRGTGSKIKRARLGDAAEMGLRSMGGTELNAGTAFA